MKLRYKNSKNTFENIISGFLFLIYKLKHLLTDSDNFNISEIISRTRTL